MDYGGILAVARYESLRERRKKAFLLLVVLALLPIAGGLAARLVFKSDVGGERLWAVFLGLDIGSGTATGLLAAVGVAGWAWLVGVLFGGDLFASDFRDGTAQLVMVRPGGRVRLALGKLAAVGLFTATFFTLTGLASVLAAMIIGGWQRDWWLAPLMGLLLGLGLYPVILISSLFGALTRNPFLGMVLGAAAYLLTGTAISLGLTVILVSEGIGSLEAWKRYTELSIIASGLIPFLAGTQLPSILYYAITLNNTFTPIPLPAVSGAGEVAITLDLKPLDVLPLYLASLTIGTAILAWLNITIIKKTEA